MCHWLCNNPPYKKPASSQTQGKYTVNQLAMVIFLTPTHRELKFQFPYLFQFGLPPLLPHPSSCCCSLLFILPTPLPWQPGQVLPRQWTPAAAILWREERCQGPCRRASFSWLTGAEEGTHRPICIGFYSIPHPAS